MMYDSSSYKTPDQPIPPALPPASSPIAPQASKDDLDAFFQASLREICAPQPMMALKRQLQNILPKDSSPEEKLAIIREFQKANSGNGYKLPDHLQGYSSLVRVALGSVASSLDVRNNLKGALAAVHTQLGTFFEKAALECEGEAVLTRFILTLEETESPAVADLKAIVGFRRPLDSLPAVIKGINEELLMANAKASLTAIAITDFNLNVRFVLEGIPYEYNNCVLSGNGKTYGRIHTANNLFNPISLQPSPPSPLTTGESLAARASFEYSSPPSLSASAHFSDIPPLQLPESTALEGVQTASRYSSAQKSWESWKSRISASRDSASNRAEDCEQHVSSPSKWQLHAKTSRCHSNRVSH